MPQFENMPQGLFKFSGNFQPWRPQKETEHAIERKLTLETGNDKFAILKLWVARPSLQYPDASLFLKVQSGDRQLFFRLDSAQLKEIGNFFFDNEGDIIETISNLSEETELCKNQCREYWEQRQKIEQMRNMAENLQD